VAEYQMLEICGKSTQRYDIFLHILELTIMGFWGFPGGHLSHGLTFISIGHSGA